MRFILIVLGTFQLISVSGQKHLLNTDSIAQMNKVKSLIVSNCLDNSGCIKDYYWFNKSGQLIKDGSAGHSYGEWEYYPDGKLKTAYSKMYSSSADTLYNSTHYYYKVNGAVDYYIFKSYENGRVTKIDTLPPKKEMMQIESTSNLNLRLIFGWPKREVPTKHNDQGQVIEQEVGNLLYPCGISYKGIHIIKYTYSANGLIMTGKIYDEQNKLIVDLKYEYEYF